MQYFEWTRYIEQLLHKAGEAILGIYETEHLLDIRRKEDSSPVTLADLTSNDILLKGLFELEPNIPFISEEMPVPLFEERYDYKRFWLVDPLDGTREFIEKTGHFCINLALMENQMPVLGFIHIPLTRETFVAFRNEGSFKLGNEGMERLQVNSFSLLDEGLVIVGSRLGFGSKELKFANHLTSPNILHVGSAIKFTLLASGKADIYPRFGRTMEWDTAAGELILQEAGGAIFNAADLSPLFYNKPLLSNPNFIATASMQDDTRILQRMID